jgi:hypothetical protein
MKMMKYIPKSKLGAVAAALYLLLVIFFVLGAFYGSGGLHGGAGMSALFAYFLSFPLGWLVTWMADSMKFEPSYKWVEYLLFIIFVLCYVFNAAVIYLLVGYVSWGLKALYKMLTKGLK